MSSRVYRGLIAAPLILLLTGGPLFAYSGQSPAVFITSTPLGVNVTLDGTPLPGTTPMLVRDIAPGVYELTFSRDGYRTISISKGLSASDFDVIDVTLSPRLIALVTPADHASRFGEFPGAESEPFLIPPGDYRLTQDSALLHVEPLYPGQSVIDGLEFAVPFFFLVAASLAVSESIAPRSSRFPVSIETLTATGVALGLMATDIALHVDRRSFFRQSVPVNGRPVPVPESEQDLWDFAQSEEAAGNLALAASIYERLVSVHPYGRRVPQSLYRAARVRLITGDLTGAEELFLRLLADYPTPDTYDLTRRNLADLYEITDRVLEAIEQIDSMVFADPTVPEDLMISRRRVLLARLNSDRR